ncbi:hypothetical protein [Nostoc sp. FACHB-888]|uniref:alpha/beta hydrolase n=1 Tax=Nostoc sp. FACHB-888 TaxID=2692842 RepID=UPI00168425AD|nr:hypothetical protein [Nostoc sp. FACHB-888]MBD2245198.1 hypothetical protein [Nostoc sp. FACHB-888]
MENEKQAIIFIPGFDANTQNYYIEHYLGIGLTSRLEGKKITLDSEDIKIAGQSGKRFIYYIDKKHKKTIDVYEVYWTDLADSLTKESQKKQLILGFDLFLFWLPKFFTIASKSKIFLIQINLFLVLMLAWYYGIVVMLLTAIGSDPNILGTKIPEGWAKNLGEIGKSFGGWSVWIIVSILLNLLPGSVNLIIDLVHFLKRYIQDETEKGLGGIRDRIRQRLNTVINDVLNEASYTKVKVLAHSVGTLIATDTLADYQPDELKKIHYITLGSPLEALTYKSVWLQQEIDKCLQNEFIETWSDFYSDQDWLCSKVPISNGENRSKIEFMPLSLRVSWLNQLLGKSHNAYFFDSKVLSKIIE